MTEHYTRNTISVTRWCNRCNRGTQHAVSAGRLGHCLEHEPPQLTRAQSAAADRRERLERERANPRLFPEEAA